LDRRRQLPAPPISCSPPLGARCPRDKRARQLVVRRSRHTDDAGPIRLHLHYLRREIGT
jgi:hypothetical protein